MEKKQITNSSTVSRRSRTHNQDQGWEPPLRLGSCHAQPFSPLLPQKGNKCVTFLWPVTTSQQDHLRGLKKG